MATHLTKKSGVNTSDSAFLQQQETHNEDYVRWYVLKRDLVRPKYNIVNFLATMVILIVGGGAIGYGLFKLLDGRWSLRLSVVIAEAVTFLSASRLVIAGLVKLYQHYASDEIRRNCLLMPTCSEYCLLAMKKYGTLVGCIKTVHRLFHTCKGETYREDWP